MEETLGDLDAVIAVDRILRDAPTLRGGAASSRTERVSPRSSSQPEQVLRGAVAGRELLRSMIADAAELSDVEQWLGSAADGAFEPIEPPWSADGEFERDSEQAVPQVAMKLACGANRLDKAARAEKQKEIAARGSAAGMVMLQSMLDCHSMSSGGTSVWPEEGDDSVASTSGVCGVVDLQAALSKAEPPEPARSGNVVSLIQNTICAPVERTALMLLGSRGMVAAHRRRLRCRSSPAVICGSAGSDSTRIGISPGWISTHSRLDVRLSEEQPWEPPDLVELEDDDGSTSSADTSRVFCREQGPEWCLDAKVSMSASKATQMSRAQPQQDKDSSVEAVNYAENEYPDKSDRDEYNYFSRAPVPLQRKRRRSPVARGGVGISAGGGTAVNCSVSPCHLS